MNAATILAGGSALISGTDSGTTISAGGSETVVGAGIVSGNAVYGTQLVSGATAIANAETIENGGTVDLFLAGVTASALTVLTGGTLAVNGHAVANDTVLNGGQIVLETSKAVLSGGLSFAGGGTIDVAAVASSGYGDVAVMSGFGAGGTIDLTMVGSGATLTTSAVGGNTVATVTSGGFTEGFTFSGTFPATTQLVLIGDGAGGTDLVAVNGKIGLRTAGAAATIAALALALGVSFDAIVAPEKEADNRFGGAQAVTFSIAIPGQNFFVQTALHNEGPEKINVSEIVIKPTDGKAWTIAPAPPAADDQEPRGEQPTAPGHHLRLGVAEPGHHRTAELEHGGGQDRPQEPEAEQPGERDPGRYRQNGDDRRGNPQQEKPSASPAARPSGADRVGDRP